MKGNPYSLSFNNPRQIRRQPIVQPLVFGLSFLFSLGLVPLARRFSLRLGKVKQPRADRWHRMPTATLGGIAIFLAFCLGLVVVAALSGQWAQLQWGILLGAGLAFLLGLLDDFHPLTPQAKLGGQILAAAVVIGLGYTTRFFSPRIANEVVAQLPNILLTFLWLVGISNAVNLLDNMDGLAGGIALITALILSYFFWRSGDVGLSAISLALAGSVLGFLVYNFPPASIFMGDSGSLFLGFTLALLAIARQPQASNVVAVVGVPTLLFLLPILDTALVTFTRLLRGQSPMQGGRDHTSHRLIAFGFSERQTLFVLYGVALVSGILAAALESIQYWFSLVLMPIVVIALSLAAAYLARLKITPSGVPSPRGGAIARIMLELTFRGRLLEVILDFFLIAVAYYLAFLAHYGRPLDETLLNLYLQSFPIALTGVYLSCFGFGVYKGVWQYVGLADLLRYLQAALGGVVLLALVVFLLAFLGVASWAITFPPLLFLLFAIFLFLGFAASRSSFRVLDLFSRWQSVETGVRVLIYGAGDMGEIALRWIWINPALDYRVIGFLDEDPWMQGKHIHGVEVLGGAEQMVSLLARHRIQGVILAGVDPSTSQCQAVIAACRQYGCWVRKICLEFETIEGD